ncbi:MAG: matrixin family metalloprotease, partial [Gammaproteobacteria bacterium]|nr:matrixin family metalloprotease [Gammaproteobacteria bacterium]
DFNDRSGDGFMVDRGQFDATGGVMAIQSNTMDETASAVFLLDDYLPSYYEVLATFNLDKPTGGWKSNGYVIFDYYSDVDFKFAGINISTNKIEMGHVDETGWHYLVQSNKPVHLKPNQNYQVTVAVNGNNVTVAVAGVNWFSYDYTPKLDALGDPIPLNRGMVGVAMDGSSGRVDNFIVQILPPDWTIDETDDFVPPAELTRTAESGTWDESTGALVGTVDASGPAVQLIDLGASLAANSILELEVDITTGDTAGYVFDRYDADNYKFVALDVANDQVIIGHATSDDGIVVDATFAHALDPASTHHLKVTMQGAGLGVSVDGTPITSYGFNAALVDGSFGLMVLDGTATFDDLDVRTNDAQFADAQALLAATPVDGYGSGANLTRDELAPLVDAAAAYWIAAGRDPELMSGLKVEITDLPNQQLGRVHENTIYIDYNAAGHGWYVDSSPFDTAEFGDADGRMDLLSVLVHEFGHLLGDDHDDSALMDRYLEAGVREIDLHTVNDTDIDADFDTDIEPITVAADDVVENLDADSILVTSSPLWWQPEVGNTPRADLPAAISGGGTDDALQSAKPAPVLVFDEELGEFVEITPAKGQAKPALPLAAYHGSDDSDNDWVVYSSSDTGSDLPAGIRMQTVAVGATLIDWDAEKGEVNFLIPPLLPGRTGMSHGKKRVATTP